MPRTKGADKDPKGLAMTTQKSCSFEDARLLPGGSDPDIPPMLTSVSSDPEMESDPMEMAFVRRLSAASLGSEGKDEDDTDGSGIPRKKNSRKKLLRGNSQGAKKPLRATLGSSTEASSPDAKTLKQSRTPVLDAFPPVDESPKNSSPTGTGASSSASPGTGSKYGSGGKYDEARGGFRKSSLMVGSALVTARRSVNRQNDENAATMTDEQKIDWEARAARVATVMFMSNAELSKGIKALEKEEVEEVAELFGLFDVDQSGALDDIELGSLIRALGFRINQEQIVQVLKWLDDEQNSVNADEKTKEKMKGRRTIVQMMEEKALEFESFVQLLLRIRAEGPPKLERKVVRPETADSKGKPINQRVVLLDALEKVLSYSNDSWPDGIPKKKLKDADIVSKASEKLIELSKDLMKERDMLESLQNDLMIFKAQLQSRNKKGVQEITAVGGKHHELKQQSIQLTNEVQAAQQQLEKEKEKYKALRTAAVPELAALDAEVAILRKRLDGWEQRVRQDSFCARDLAELQKAKESRLRELAPKVTQCSELQKKCEASYQVNVVLKSLLLECCANFDTFITKKEAPVKRLGSCGLDVQTCVKELIDDHERLNKVSMVAPEGVPDPAVPLVTGTGGAD